MGMHAEMACRQGNACMTMQVCGALSLVFSYSIIAQFQGIEVSK